MIIIKVQGGLGNQLFQYSIGKVVSLASKQEVLYDISFFTQNTQYTKRPYLLDRFALVVPIATDSEITKVRYPYGLVSRCYSFFFRVINKFFLKKYYIGYDASFIPLINQNSSLGKDMYFEGFWQSYQYYIPYREELSKDINLKNNEAVEIVKRKFSFENTNTVAVHIRRGDYLNSGSGVAPLSIQYYRDAVYLMEKSIMSPRYFVFSDDVEWVKKEMSFFLKNVVYIDSSYNLHDYEEFILMKECKHAIIANSTFSFFAALLSTNVNKVVLYPKDWKNSYIDKGSDICPPEWKGL